MLYIIIFYQTPLKIILWKRLATDESASPLSDMTKMNKNNIAEKIFKPILILIFWLSLLTGLFLNHATFATNNYSNILIISLISFLITLLFIGCVFKKTKKSGKIYLSIILIIVIIELVSVLNRLGII